jgi:hypothetical protein
MKRILKRWGMSKKMGGLPHPPAPNEPGASKVQGVALRAHNWRAEPQILDLGYREADGIHWYPVVGKCTRIQSVARDEAFEVIAAPRMPLAGHHALPCVEWLSEPEECIVTSVTQTLYDMWRSGEFVAKSPVLPGDVYSALFLLFREASFLNKRASGVTRANLEHALLLKNRARAFMNALKDPRTPQIYGASWLDDSLINAEKEYRRFAWTADAIERELPRRAARARAELTQEGAASCQTRADNLEEFVRGPLAFCYNRLFDRDAGGNERGPFARFGKKFFDLVGHPVAVGTIAKGVKPQPPTRRPRPSMHTYDVR